MVSLGQRSNSDPEASSCWVRFRHPHIPPKMGAAWTMDCFLKALMEKGKEDAMFLLSGWLQIFDIHVMELLAFDESRETNTFRTLIDCQSTSL